MLLEIVDRCLVRLSFLLAGKAGLGAASIWQCCQFHPLGATQIHRLGFKKGRGGGNLKGKGLNLNFLF